MKIKKSKIRNFFNAIFFFAGLSLGITIIWPGLLKNENRKCFLKIIEDGSDGKVTIETILSIDPTRSQEIVPE